MDYQKAQALTADAPYVLGANIGGVTAKPPTPVDRTRDALRAAHEVVDRVASLRERLLGSYPVDASKMSQTPAQGGVLNELADSADVARERLLRALDDLDVIGRALP